MQTSQGQIGLTNLTGEARLTLMRVTVLQGADAPYISVALIRGAVLEQVTNSPVSTGRLDSLPLLLPLAFWGDRFSERRRIVQVADVAD
jgi:hypothetical protein